MSDEHPHPLESCPNDAVQRPLSTYITTEQHKTRDTYKKRINDEKSFDNLCDKHD